MNLKNLQLRKSLIISTEKFEPESDDVKIVNVEHKTVERNKFWTKIRNALHCIRYDPKVQYFTATTPTTTSTQPNLSTIELEFEVL